MKAAPRAPRFRRRHDRKDDLRSHQDGEVNLYHAGGFRSLPRRGTAALMAAGLLPRPQMVEDAPRIGIGAHLIEQVGAKVVQAQFLIELGFLNGRPALAPTPVYSLLSYA